MTKANVPQVHREDVRAAFVDAHGVVHRVRSDDSLRLMPCVLWCLCDHTGPTYGAYTTGHLTCLECVYIENMADSFHRKLSAIFQIPESFLRGELP